MNKNKWLVVALALSMSMGYTSCKKDAPVQTTTEEVASDIKTDVEELMLGVGETSKIEILSGGGTYKVFSENPDILEATLEGNTINIVSKTKGWGGVVISDAKGVYKRISIGSRYKALSLDTEKVSDLIKLGNEGSPKAINVLAGNGEYKAVSSDPSVVRINYVQGDVISIVAMGKGTAKVTITDLMGVTAEVPVEVEVTTKYYLPEEIEALKAHNADACMFDGSDLTSRMTYGTRNFAVADGRASFRWEQGWSYKTTFELAFDGDLTLGAKQGGRVAMKTAYATTPVVLDAPEVEVIKVTDTRVWIIFSQLKDGKVVGGLLIAARPA